MKKILVLALLACSLNVSAGNRIKAYFNHPVDTTVSTTIHARYLNHCMHDTVIAYINRANFSLDIAMYNYTQGVYDTIAYAINAAYTRGVHVRVIHDGSTSNTGFNLLNPAIQKLSSPSTGSYTLMHNKFMVVDAESPNPNDPVVMSGSCNWTSQQFFTDYNNIIFIQDSALAKAYTAEFNMMWGSTGLIPDSAHSKFGNHKTDLGMHNFTIDGTDVELYFSPSDNTVSHIQSVINTANTDLYFGMYSFTDSIEASLILSKFASGVYVSGISDTSSHTYTPDSMFRAGIGSRYICYSGTGLFHNKYVIVDQANACSDPIILTGSHNWSAVANTNNDENTLIVHDDTLANVYYQSFHANFIAFGGTLTIPTGCPTSLPTNSDINEDGVVYPNPTEGNFTVKMQLASAKSVSVEVLNILGQNICSATWTADAGSNLKNFYIPKPGIYFVILNFGDKKITTKLVID